VLPGASREPTEKECEELRQQTIEFWSKRLEDVYLKVFERLDLHFGKALFGAEHLEPRFNMYFEVGGDATFSGRAPTAEHVFGVMVGGDSSNYLMEYVRKVNAKSLFADAVEICARRLIVDKKMPGTVRAPSFCVAFASDDGNREPTEEECEEYKKLTHKAIVENLKKAYPHTFVSCDLDVLSAEAGAQKPDERFNLYLENDASATFSSDPPSPAELFDVIMKCSSGGTEYLISISEIEGSPFETVTMVTIQLISLEMPVVEPLPPPEEPPEQEPGEEEAAGDEDDIMEPITVEASIFLALVLMVEPPASLPGAEELAEFRNLIHRFFYALMKSEYPEIFLDLHLKLASTKFGAGLPDERFNMCEEYDAEVLFRADSVPPDAMVLRMLIVQCNLSSILTHVQTLKPLCFAKTTEVSMRRIGEKEKSALIQDKPFEAAIELSDPTKEAKEKPKQLKPKKHSPMKKVAEKKKPIEMKPKKHAPTKKVEEKEKPIEMKPKKHAPTKVEEKEKPIEMKPKKHAPTKKVEAKEKPKEIEPKKLAPTREPRKEAKEKPKEIKPKKLASTQDPPKEAKEKYQEIKPKKLAPTREPPKEAKEKPKELKPKKLAPTQDPPKEAKEKPQEIKPMKLEKKNKPAKKDPKTPSAPIVVNVPVAAKEESTPVKSSDMYIAYKLDGVDSEPTPEEYEQLRQQTHEYFVLCLKEAFPKQFATLNLQIGLKEFGAGKPDPKYNVYVEWDMQASFTSSSSSASKRVSCNNKISVPVDSDVPGPVELVQALLSGVDYIEYLVNHVRTIEDYAFATTTQVFAQQRIGAT
jgi:hypothetical protein